MAFRFKHFVIEDDRSTMPVGTDAMLLGSWADPGDAGTILDIGTGSGVLSLMMAQKSAARIDAIDIDPDSSAQAQLNFAQSPWGDRLVSHCIGLEPFVAKRPERFSFIISNPPFFARSFRSPAQKRNLARHETGLSHDTLLSCINGLLTDDGRFAVILPVSVFTAFSSSASNAGINPERLVTVRSFSGKKPLRMLALLSKSRRIAPVQEELIIFEAPGRFSGEYLELTSGFHNF
jgi:tRNA1Val (adenine37-N6)-methyltransferase